LAGGAAVEVKKTSIGKRGTPAGRRVLHQNNTAQLFLPIKGRARIQPEAESTLGFTRRLVGRHCMGETLLLLSCGAAFITGLVIAAANLFG
jgi:hypothetical protein